MTVIIDADACPVTGICEKICREKGIAVIAVCDTSHIINSEYMEIKVVDKGSGSADIAIVNLCKKSDIVITQDYGVASMALGKGSYVLHQSGMEYTHQNIENLMEMRHVASEFRRKNSKHHLKGPKKRTKEDDERFTSSFLAILKKASENT